ncbi:hypothetical protein IscW_ISCW019200 [Ixodes scapularis]|uniref:TRAF3-interacting protein 1 C-terminal domain-containing protein n=1 Tax=Ixodes scapularis TaxID=6945 RepID=B7PMS6_IXOSC|nr:hypothetical protein IscW_ISCW019200 [Ixodes scapularis]|eukprot:XP_002435074.1 hypothetical protein IscW_ISCW019200 [Ixodes scapularis]
MQAPNDIKRPRSTKRSSKQELQTTKDESRDMSNGSNMVAQPDPEILLPPEQNYTAEQPTHDQELERPPTRSSLRSSRPRSSRPAAPRIRKKEDVPAESAAAPRAVTAKSVENVILDGNAPENEEDKEEEFVVAEPLVEPVTDLDYMNTELKAWAEEHAKNLKAFTAEQSMTDSVLEPLRQNLEDLDRQIADQMDAISATKASIFSNAERLEKMLAAANIGR